MKKILVIGSGGREHAIAWKLAQSPQVAHVYCAPGNAGTSTEEKCENIPLNRISELKSFALKNEVDLTVVGPEAPLTEGIVDDFEKDNLLILGPSKEAAQLEGSKDFAKEFMNEYGIKTAEHATFTDSLKAIQYLETAKYPIVIKADGLAAGKGVIICEDFNNAKETVNQLMNENSLGEAGEKIVIERFLVGKEASILTITDGKAIKSFISSMDHKSIYENNQGPNTGGMGVIAPNPYCTEEIIRTFEKDIMHPTLKGIQDKNLNYKGIIFFGIMICDDGIYCLEYNVRMGDPETQAILPLLKSDLFEVFERTTKRELDSCDLLFENQHSCCVVAASKGYPMDYETGLEIKVSEKLRRTQGSKVFFAGATDKDGKIFTAGGRVLSSVSQGTDPTSARNLAYNHLNDIQFDGIYYRKDIGIV